ncbi:MAG: NAD(P)-dependent oxidoreductase [bacterium]|nr:NAD(P)-dependent oxidoreductase [bacterium]MDE0287983.1 NAD(P)-dependent oxidoreductase [bacterium]MDE0438080.1 NAD(P)-dependent oxidoreductase [bacterium]
MSGTGDMRVGFIGLGRMGYPMASNIAAAGFPLTVWNRTAAKAEALATETGASVAASPADLASGVDIVITMVADGEVLAGLYMGSGAMCGSLAAGTLCVDMSTVSPTESRQVAEAVEAAGGRFVDAPVSGSTAIATAGTLTIMAGGQPGDVETLRPVFEAMGSRVYHMGPVGSGATIKLAVNSIVYGLGQAVAEALVLAEASGIGRESAYEVFANSAIAAPFVHYRREAFLKPGEVPVAFRMVLARKDLDLALGLAESAGASMPQAVLNRSELHDAIGAGFGDHDMSAVAEYLRSALDESG